MNNKVNDRILLIVSGIVAAGLSFFFYRVTGENAFSIINGIVILSLVVDNHILRKRIKGLTQKLAQHGGAAEATAGGNSPLLPR